MLNNFRPLSLAALLAVSASASFAGTITFDNLPSTLQPGTLLSTVPALFSKDGLSFTGDAALASGVGANQSTRYGVGSNFEIDIDAGFNYDSISLFGQVVQGITVLIWYESTGTKAPGLAATAEVSKELTFISNGGLGEWVKGEGSVAGRITRIQVSNGGGSDVLAFDDISFGPTNSGGVVPEPQSYALAGLALVAAGAASRRRSSAKRPD